MSESTPPMPEPSPKPPEAGVPANEGLFEPTVGPADVAVNNPTPSTTAHGSDIDAEAAIHDGEPDNHKNTGKDNAKEPSTRRSRQRARRLRPADAPGLTKHRDEPVFGLVLLVVSVLLLVLLAIGLTGTPIRPGTEEANTLNRSAESWLAHTPTRPATNTAPNTTDNAAPRSVRENGLASNNAPGENSDTNGQAASNANPSWVFTDPKPNPPHPWQRVPMESGEPTTDRPPGLVWLHEQVFGGVGIHAFGMHLGLPPLDPSQTHPDEWTQRARWLNALICVLGVGLVGWAGFCVGRLTTGALALLVAATSPPIIWHATMATDAIVQMTAAVFATATGVWAIRPLRPDPALPRQVVGFGGCGLGLAACVLFGGPGLAVLALWWVVWPAMLCPRRGQHAVGLLAALTVACLALLPWMLSAFAVSEAHGWAWLSAFDPDWTWVQRGLAETFRDETGTMVWLTSPWLMWLMVSLFQVTSTSSHGLRARLLIGTGWLLGGILIVGTVSAAMGPSHRMVLIWPAIAWTIAQGFRRFYELSSEGRHARLWLGLRWVQLAFLIAGTVAIGALCDQPAWLGPGFSFLGEWIRPTHAGYAGAATAMAALTALIACRHIVANHPARFLAAYAAFLYTLMVSLAGPVSQSPHMLSRPQPEIPSALFPEVDQTPEASPPLSS